MTSATSGPNPKSSQLLEGFRSPPPTKHLPRSSSHSHSQQGPSEKECLV